MKNEALLKIENLKKYYPIRKGFLRRHTTDVKALDGISFTVKAGETLGIVGESGCGKSTLGKSIIRLHESTAGKVFIRDVDFFSLTGGALRQMRRKVQMIFQDPFASLDPRMTVSAILKEPLVVHGIGDNREKREKVRDLMETVGLNPIYQDRYPHEFSGGQRQRIGVARCLALNPELIIADEPVSALDVSIQAQVLNLLKKLQEQLGLTYLFISHDLSVIEHMCNHIAVMYLGNMVEKAERRALFDNPCHPYTQALMDAVPVVGKGKKKERTILQGDVASPLNPPSGCKFHTRCPRVMARCKTEPPALKPVGEDHLVACWLMENHH